jgi:hypothetical protein
LYRYLDFLIFSLLLQYPWCKFNFHLYLSSDCNFRVLMIVYKTFGVTEVVDFFHCPRMEDEDQIPSNQNS